VSETDFLEAFSHLLRDGNLRDACAREPARTAGLLGVTSASAEILQGLKAEDLEFQARVLLRKRYDLVRRLVPRTCAALDASAWPVFYGYARLCWPEEPRADLHDAAGFCRHLERRNPKVLSGAEKNRMLFALARNRLAFHFVRDLPIRGRVRWGLQILVRYPDSAWHEYAVYPSL
jgi:hypothetical protein